MNYGEYPTGCGIRVGDQVTYRGPGGDTSTVTKVDYSAHLAYVEWTPGEGEWEKFSDLWVEAETTDA